MNIPHRNNTLYKLDVSFPEVHGNRLEFTDDAGETTQSPPRAASFPSPSQNIRLVPASEILPSPAPPATSKVKGSVQFANEIKVDYFFYPNQPVDQPIRMRREIYDDDQGVLLYYLEICEEGLEKIWNIPHRTIRCQINGKKGVIARLNKDKQRHQELELAGYGHSGIVEVEGKGIGRATPINHKMKDKVARLKEELKEEQLLTPAELEIARKTAENTKMNTGTFKTFEEMMELTTPVMRNKRRHFTPSSIIPPPHYTLRNASDKNATEDQRKRARVSETNGKMPGDPLRIPDEDAQRTSTKPNTTEKKRTPKPTERGIGAEKPLQWDKYLEATGKKSTAAPIKRRVLRGSCLKILHPFFSAKKSKKAQL
ncbi:hypothetical protein B9Z19DRAFT_1129689 [Tuber borchii]|uniref:Uncharacterized protein n=1 Tax=Tuber borchii TaxID=42251 RepID=A0A2T6ZLV9_TUBBO|nr:hypothetical protein B9Z19DRAFT_1129689 [Tuber borchii]